MAAFPMAAAMTLGKDRTVVVAPAAGNGGRHLPIRNGVDWQGTPTTMKNATWRFQGRDVRCVSCLHGSTRMGGG
jgi:hypothetical protein